MTYFVDLGPTKRGEWMLRISESADELTSSSAPFLWFHTQEQADEYLTSLPLNRADLAFVRSRMSAADSVQGRIDLTADAFEKFQTDAARNRERSQSPTTRGIDGFRFEKRGKLFPGPKHTNFFEACRAWDAMRDEDVTVVGVDLRGNAVRRFSSQDCRSQLARGPGSGILLERP